MNESEQGRKLPPEPFPDSPPAEPLSRSEALEAELAALEAMLPPTTTGPALPEEPMGRE